MKKLALVFALFFLSACSDHSVATSANKATQPETSASTSSILKTTTPTLLIHGYSGGKGSFASLLRRMEINQRATHEMTLTILENGTISASGQLSGEATNPLVQVIFEDNTSHEWNQAKWIEQALTYLKNTFNVKQVNLVGHSMGGISSLRYLGSAHDSDQPAVMKFSAIGSPFNEFLDTLTTQSLDDLLTNGPDEHSPRYDEYPSLILAMPNIPVQLIAGQLSETDLSDGTVPLASALAISPLLTQKGIALSTHIITKNGQHSQLHENQEVDDLLTNFLWE